MRRSIWGHGHCHTKAPLNIDVHWLYYPWSITRGPQSTWKCLKSCPKHISEISAPIWIIEKLHVNFLAQDLHWLCSFTEDHNGEQNPVRNVSQRLLGQFLWSKAVWKPFGVRLHWRVRFISGPQAAPKEQIHCYICISKDRQPVFIIQRQYESLLAIYLHWSWRFTLE